MVAVGEEAEGSGWGREGGRWEWRRRRWGRGGAVVREEMRGMGKWEGGVGGGRWRWSERRRGADKGQRGTRKRVRKERGV